MAPAKDPDTEKPPANEEADLAQAYRDLLRGEQAATALEANLTNLESKLDAILAALEAAEAAKSTEKPADQTSNGKQ